MGAVALDEPLADQLAPELLERCAPSMPFHTTPRQLLAHTSGAAIVIVGGLRELTVNALEQDRDIDDLRSSAAQIAKAIIATAAF